MELIHIKWTSLMSITSHGYRIHWLIAKILSKLEQKKMARVKAHIL
jgi:hypothetical protein